MSRINVLLSRWLRTARRSFHLLVGLVFLVLAAAGALVSVSEWRSFKENQALGWSHFGTILGFTILLVILSLYSFVRARSVR